MGDDLNGATFEDLARALNEAREATAAATAAAAAAQSELHGRRSGSRDEGLVDTRLLSKPSPFDGRQSEWRAWKFYLENYVGAVDGEMLDQMGHAAVLNNEVPSDSLSTSERQKGRTLYYLLASLCGLSYVAKCIYFGQI